MSKYSEMPLLVVGLLLALILLSACQPVQVPAAVSEVDAKIAVAMSAAPVEIAKDATILDWPTEEGGDMVLLREGTNDWTCFTDWPVTPGAPDPACYDLEWGAWNEAFAKGETPQIKSVGIGYMLAGGVDPSNTDPLAMEPAPGEDWVVTPPHIMLIAPGGFDPALFATEPHAGQPYIMFKDTPYEHLMVPVDRDAVTASHPLALAPTPIAEETVANINAYLDDEFDKGRFTGAALIARDGEILWSNVWGLADRQQGTPNTLDTVFLAGELGTQFTGAAALLLEQQGKLSLQDSICQYLDDCPDTWQAITLHHLLSHTSGIPDYFDARPMEAHELTVKGATPESVVALFRDLPLEFEPGAQRVWSHSGFTLAALVIEHVAGQSYADYMQQQLFEPLGMTHSGCDTPPAALAPGYYWDTAKTPATYDPSSLFGSGNCYTTVGDLYRWNEGLHTGDLLNADELAKMLTSHAITAYNEGAGYGIVLRDFNGRRLASNAGGPDDYSSISYRFLDDNVTFVAIGNQWMEYIFDIADQVSTIYFGDE